MFIMLHIRCIVCTLTDLNYRVHSNNVLIHLSLLIINKNFKNKNYILYFFQVFWETFVGIQFRREVEDLNSRPTSWNG